MSDMNSHPVHLFKYLKAVVLTSTLRRNSFEEAELNKLWTEVARLWQMDATTLSSALKINHPEVETVADQLAIADFANPGGLLRVGENMFQPASNSGVASVGVAGTGGRGLVQAGAVKIAKMAAHSAPNSLPGNSPTKKVTVKVRKPSTGTDWRMSSAGMMTISARRLLAASVATVNVKTSEAMMAANMRSVVRSA